MDDKTLSKKIIFELIKKYGKKIPVYLLHNKNKPYEFLFSVMMSAQCTDDRVNKVTRSLYKKYDTLEKFAKVKSNILERDIFSVGFHHNKARNIILCAKELLNKYNGKIPNDFDLILSLPGVGRKTASVVISHLYKKPAMAVDTHVFRISNLLFDFKIKKVENMEIKLKEIVDKKYWNIWNTHLIALGREICKAKNPKCHICFLKKYCKNSNNA